MTWGAEATVESQHGPQGGLELGNGPPGSWTPKVVPFFLEGRLLWVLSTLGPPTPPPDLSDVMSVKCAPSPPGDVMTTLHTPNKANGQCCVPMSATFQHWRGHPQDFQLQIEFNRFHSS